jgi:O-antigen/teichoic acid export membrane protein
MKEITQRLMAHPKYARIIEWGKLISITGSVQLLVQASGLLTGIIIIRMLPTKEYAYYTLANTMLGTMTILADGGISSGVMVQGGKVWRNKTQLGAVLATGLKLRKQFAIASLFVAVPILVYLLLHQGASLWVITLVVVSVIPSFYAALSDSMLEIIPKLHQDIKPLQSNQALVGLLRLALSSLSVFIFPFTFIALLANGIPRMFGNIKLKKIASRLADETQTSSLEYEKEILKVVKKTFPGALYYCLSGQITIWLISIFGTTSSIAQIGALTRLSMFLTVFTVIFSTLIVPRYARISNNKGLLLKYFLQILAGLCFLGIAIIGFVYIFPHQLLWILGKDYSGLSQELLLSMIGSCLALISSSVFAISTCRGYIIYPLVSIPLNLLTLVIGIYLFDVNTIYGILLLNIMIAAVQIVMLVVFFFIKVLNLKNQIN